MDVRQRRSHRQQEKQPTSSPEKTKPSSSNNGKMDDLRVESPERRPRGRRSGHAQWLFFAVASGACAAFNGVFAKLTTTELTTSLSGAIARLLGISIYEKGVELSVRVFFFILNLTFNGIMWSLFTTALARGTSATQVSIMNTSTNFLITAIMGMVIFSEALPPLWWAGASLLVAGSVIAGRQDEDAGVKEAEAEQEGGYAAVPGQEPEEDGVAKDYQGEDEDVAELGSL